MLAGFGDTMRMHYAGANAAKPRRRHRVIKLKQYTLAQYGADSLVQKIYKRSDLWRKMPPLGVDNVDVESG